MYDEFTIRSDKDEIAILLALNVTLYFNAAHTQEKRQAIINCCKNYLREWSPRMRWIAFDETDFARTPKDVNEFIRGYLHHPSRDDPDECWALIVHSGESSADASDYRILAFAQPAAEAAIDRSLSFLCFTVDLCLLQQPGMGRRWIDFIAACCEELVPVHGYSSPTLITAADSGLAAAYANAVYGLAQRYEGVDVDYPFDHSIWLGDLVKTPCWLTIFGKSILPKLGDIKSIEMRLGSGAELLSYDHGLMIRSSPLPELGDKNRKNKTPGLRALSSIISKVQLPEHGGVGNSFDGKFDEQTFTAWLHRFE